MPATITLTAHIQIHCQLLVSVLLLVSLHSLTYYMLASNQTSNVTDLQLPTTHPMTDSEVETLCLPRPGQAWSPDRDIDTVEFTM